MQTAQGIQSAVAKPHYGTLYAFCLLQGRVAYKVHILFYFYKAMQ